MVVTLPPLPLHPPFPHLNKPYHTMLQDDHHNSRGSANGGNDVYATEVRDIHALTSPPQPSSFHLAPGRGGRSNSSSLSIGSNDAENFTTMSREFSALVVAGTTMQSDHSSAAPADAAPANLGRIGEDQEEMMLEETNPLAIVPDSNPIPSPRPAAAGSSLVPSGSDDGSSSHASAAAVEEMSVHRVKKEEVKSKIAAWQTAEIAKINNRFKREDVVINGWESEQVEKASAWLKKLERKLDKQRARAVEKMQNDVAKARRKAEEKRASAEAKRGTKVAKVLELSHLLRTVGRTPSKRSIF